MPQRGPASLFVDGRKLSNEVRDYLETLADVREPDAFDDDLKTLGAAKAAVRLDSATAADALARIITDAGGTVTRAADPIALMKAVKNAAEIAGTRAAHLRDGAAVATSWPGSTARRRAASSPRSTPSRRWKPSAAIPAR